MHSFRHPEQNLEVKLQHIGETIFKVLNLSEVEKTCIEGDYGSFGLESSQEILARMRVEYAEQSEDYGDMEEDEDDDDDVEFVGVTPTAN